MNNCIRLLCKVVDSAMNTVIMSTLSVHRFLHSCGIQRGSGLLGTCFYVTYMDSGHFVKYPHPP